MTTKIDPLEADGRGEGLSGMEVIIARASLQLINQKLVIVSEQTVSNALELAIDTFRITMIVTSIALVFAIVLVVITTRRIVRPIEALAASARSISDGDFSKQV